jgi:hypothetical protein
MDIKVDLTAIVVVSVVFLTSAVIVALVLYFVHRARELRHATIRLALEKGQPLPLDLLEGAPERKAPGSELNSGVKAVFIGVGLSLFFFFFHQALWPVGLIPIFVGLGHLAAYALTGRAAPTSPPAV